jgi:hypothetical protein
MKQLTRLAIVAVVGLALFALVHGLQAFFGIGAFGRAIDFIASGGPEKRANEFFAAAETVRQSEFWLIWPLITLLQGWLCCRLLRNVSWPQLALIAVPGAVIAGLPSSDRILGAFGLYLVLLLIETTLIQKQRGRRQAGSAKPAEPVAAA